MANTNLAIFFRDGKLAEFLNDRQDIDEQTQIKKMQDRIKTLTLNLRQKNIEFDMTQQEHDKADKDHNALMNGLISNMQKKYNEDTSALRKNIELIQKQYDECKHTAITKIEKDVIMLRKKVDRLENEKTKLKDEIVKLKAERKTTLQRLVAFRTARKPDASKLPFEDVKRNVDLLARLKKEYSEASDPPIGTIPDHGPTNIKPILGINAGKDGINYIQLFVNEFKSLHDIPTTNIEAYATEFRSILDEFFLGPPGQKQTGRKRDGWSKSFDAKLRQTSIQVPEKWAGYDIIPPTRE